MRAAVALLVLALVAIVLVPSASPTPSGRHVHVSASGSDDGDGSRARPWRTLQRAASVARPGYTVHVGPGRYRGPVTIGRGGTPARTVRFVSDRRWAARISARGTGAVVAVDIRGDHVTVEGFDVAAQGGPGTVGISAEADQVSVVRNRVSDVHVPCRGDGGAGISVGSGWARYGNEDARIDGNLVQRIGRGRRDGSCRLVHGIYAAVPRVTIANNIVSDAVGDGITSWHRARELTVANNLAMRNGGVGILVGAGDAGATAAGHTDTVVANNIVYRNAIAGIVERSDGRHRVGPSNRYLHNLVYGHRRGFGIEGIGPGAVITGTLTVDPRLAGPALGSRQPYRLHPASPAIDAGTCVAAPSRDYRGTARPQNHQVDVGPYEHPAHSRASVRP
jgi:hypothetical protein